MPNGLYIIPFDGQEELTSYLAIRREERNQKDNYWKFVETPNEILQRLPFRSLSHML